METERVTNIGPCDRCGIDIIGFSDGDMTAGYYHIVPGGYWSQFARIGECKICDACMFADEGYRKIYGIHGGGK